MKQLFISTITFLMVLMKARGGTPEFTMCSSLEFKGKSKNIDIILNNNLISNQLCRVQGDNRSSIEFEENWNYGGIEFVASALAYDSHDDAVYHTRENFTIRKTYLGGLCGDHDDEDVFILEEELRPSLGAIMDISYDWITRNIFIAFEKAVGLINPSLKRPLKILSSGESFIGIEVHPNRGYLFLLSPARNSSDGVHCNSFIIRAYQDFTVKKTAANKTGQFVPGRGCQTISSMAIDHLQEYLYYVTAPFWGITLQKLYGGTPSDIQLSPGLYHASPLAVDDRFIYIAREEKDQNQIRKKVMIKRIANNYTYYDDWTFSLENGNNSCKSMLLPNKDLQIVKEGHPCAVDNGGCENYCLVVPDGPENENYNVRKVCI
ncbi:hypothetical protein QAD02_015579 [Eretmocerus hayati]|uniref:Uncharacterized protein n=1 Tax=Eretmocerus hayati TaxID=131215 RepID=A0ACC2P915_9HYME|nr:hypothetical protein QAD02_015579 [Eretmocerus hayati]